MPQPNPADYFEKASLLGLLRKRHPYDFVETYETMRSLYDYDGYYMNLGLWEDGPGTRNAGARLAAHMGRVLQLHEGARLLDVGSGPGQCAVDLAQLHHLNHVLGININTKQIAFANALAAAAGLADKVRHIQGDASRLENSTAVRTWTHVLALECINHFPDIPAFLRGARQVLVSGGRLAFCTNVARGPFTWLEKQIMQLSYGFIPAREETWTPLLEQAGFTVVLHEDLTDRVLRPLIQRLEQPSLYVTRPTTQLPPGGKLATQLLTHTVSKTVSSNRLGYICMVAQVP